jgi:hypothetical protein
VKSEPGLSLHEVHLTRKRLFSPANWTYNLRKRLVVKCYIWNLAWCGAETWTLRKVDQKYLGSFEMWYWRKMERISWTDHVRNERNITESRRKGISHKD